MVTGAKFSKDIFKEHQSFLKSFQELTTAQKVQILDYLVENSKNEIRDLEAKQKTLDRWSDEEIIAEWQRLRYQLPVLSGASYQIAAQEYRSFKQQLQNARIIVKKLQNKWVVDRDYTNNSENLEKNCPGAPVMQWSQLIKHPSVTLILGFRRMGKSALGYYLADTLGDHYGLEKVSFGVMEEYRHLIPQEFLITFDIEGIPSNSVVVMDGLALHAHGRETKSKRNLMFDEFIDESGKNKQIVLGITHHSRKIDINLVTDIDNLIYKKPSQLQIQFDRHEVRKLAGEASSHLEKLDKSWSYVFSFIGDWKGLMQNPLPLFWSEELSNMRYCRMEGE